MIKVTENVVEPQQVEIQYPCLMKNKTDGSIVLFFRLDCGVVLKEGGFKWKVGLYATDWATHTFVPIDYPITLENQF